MKNIFFTLFLCLLIQGCASTTTITMKLVPQVLNEQKIIDQDGSNAVISHKKSSVALRPPPDGYSLEGRPMIYVSVYGTEKSFDFSTENIQAFVDGNPHRVLAYDDLEAEIKSKKEKKVTEIETRYEAQSRNTAEGGYTSNVGAVPGPGSKRAGDGEYRGAVSSAQMHVENVAEGQSDLEVKKKAEIDAIEIETEKTLAALNAVMLKKTTVLPNKWHRGYTAIEKIPDPARPHEIKIIVAVAGEEHEFLFNHSKIQQ